MRMRRYGLLNILDPVPTGLGMLAYDLTHAYNSNDNNRLLKIYARLFHVIQAR